MRSGGTPSVAMAVAREYSETAMTRSADRAAAGTTILCPRDMPLVCPSGANA